jgi:hypothetical protein
MQASCEIVIHTYDYIWPDGRPFKLGPVKAGPWVKPFLDAVGLTQLADQRVVSTWLLDQFAALLESLAGSQTGFQVVNSLGTLTKQSQWANEIHPTKSGFKLIAEQRWKPVLLPLV